MRLSQIFSHFQPFFEVFLRIFRDSWGFLNLARRETILTITGGFRRFVLLLLLLLLLLLISSITAAAAATAAATTATTAAAVTRNSVGCRYQTIGRRIGQLNHVNCSWRRPHLKITQHRAQRYSHI